MKFISHKKGMHHNRLLIFSELRTRFDSTWKCFAQKYKSKADSYKPWNHDALSSGVTRQNRIPLRPGRVWGPSGAQNPKPSPTPEEPLAPLKPAALPQPRSGNPAAQDAANAPLPTPGGAGLGCLADQRFRSPSSAKIHENPATSFPQQLVGDRARSRLHPRRLAFLRPCRVRHVGW